MTNGELIKKLALASLLTKIIHSTNFRDHEISSAAKAILLILTSTETTNMDELFQKLVPEILTQENVDFIRDDTTQVKGITVLKIKDETLPEVSPKILEQSDPNEWFQNIKLNFNLGVRVNGVEVSNG